MNICLVKVTGREKAGFLPADTAAEELVNKLADGEIQMFKLMRIRSLSWHNMYFGICREIGKNQEPQRSEDSIDSELRIRAGHYTVMYIEGHEIRSPKRIAFDKMTQDEWEELWPSLELAIREHFGETYLREVSAA